MVDVVHLLAGASGVPHRPTSVVLAGRGHARRYALSSRKIMRETGWRPEIVFEDGLARTIDWYQANAGWVARLKSGEYQSYYQRNYLDREHELRDARRH
jgi:dTDP-glucose 4,6-dehydratase